MQALEILDISSSGVTDAILAEIAKLPHLRELWLDGPWTTDTGVRNLAGLKELQTLSLGGSHITDEGLQVVTGFPKLTRLRLPGAGRVTASGIEKLQATLPNCKIDR